MYDILIKNGKIISGSGQEIVGSAGMLPGTSAVISLLVTPEYIDYWKIPRLTEEDVNKYISVIIKAIKKLYEGIDIAREELKDKYSFDREYLENLLQFKGGVKE